jgi:hypothetical protein
MVIFSLPFFLCIFAWVQKAFADYLRIKERQRALCFSFLFFLNEKTKSEAAPEPPAVYFVRLKLEIQRQLCV